MNKSKSKKRKIDKDANVEIKKSTVVIASIILVIILIYDGIMIINVFKSHKEIVPTLSSNERSTESYNAQYTMYEGDDICGDNVINLCNKVATNNYKESAINRKTRVGILKEQKDDTKFSTEDPDNLVDEKGNKGEEYNKLSTEKSYVVKCYYNVNGWLKSIIVSPAK